MIIENVSDLAIVKKDVRYVLVKSDTCPVCKKIKIGLNNYPSDIIIYAVDVQEFGTEVKKFGIVGIPCLLKFIDGIEEKRTYGNKTIEKLEKFLA